MHPIRETLQRVRRRLRSHRKRGDFAAELRHIGEETGLTLAVLCSLALVHASAKYLGVGSQPIVAQFKVDDFLNVAHAANLVRLVGLSFGVKIF